MKTLIKILIGIAIAYIAIQIILIIYALILTTQIEP
jgi:hypothetical protein